MAKEAIRNVSGASSSSLVMEVENLAAARGLRVLFENLSLRLSSGEVLELRGPNGSGKSTLLRILAGLTRAHAGAVKFTGADDDPPHHYLGHSDAVKPAETAREQARFWARYFGYDAKAGDAALERVDLASRTAVPGRGLSAGQKRRLALVRLLIDPRPIWLLDEPTAALDVDGRKLVTALVDEQVRGGGMVIAAIHGEGFAGSRTLDLATLPRPVVA
jgi:heme exporter protein A